MHQFNELRVYGRFYNIGLVVSMYVSAACIRRIQERTSVTVGVNAGSWGE